MYLLPHQANQAQPYMLRTSFYEETKRCTFSFLGPETQRKTHSFFLYFVCVVGGKNETREGGAPSPTAEPSPTPYEFRIPEFVLTVESVESPCP